GLGRGTRRRRAPSATALRAPRPRARRTGPALVARAPARLRRRELGHARHRERRRLRRAGPAARTCAHPADLEPLRARRRLGRGGAVAVRARRGGAAPALDAEASNGARRAGETRLRRLLRGKERLDACVITTTRFRCSALAATSLRLS